MPSFFSRLKVSASRRYLLEVFDGADVFIAGDELLLAEFVEFICEFAEIFVLCRLFDVYESSDVLQPETVNIKTDAKIINAVVEVVFFIKFLLM